MINIGLNVRDARPEVLKYCDSIYETLVLTTPQPEFYLPFGFRVVEEHIFKVKCNSTGSTDSFRILDFIDPKDYTLDLLHKSNRPPLIPPIYWGET